MIIYNLSDINLSSEVYVLRFLHLKQHQFVLKKSKLTKKKGYWFSLILTIKSAALIPRKTENLFFRAFQIEKLKLALQLKQLKVTLQLEKLLSET